MELKMDSVSTVVYFVGCIKCLEKTQNRKYETHKDEQEQFVLVHRVVKSTE